MGKVLTKRQLTGMVIVFQVTRAKDIVGLRVSSVGVAGEEKLRFMHGFIFIRGGATVRKTGGTRER